MARDMNGNALIPGVNVDPVNVSAGLAMAAKFGYGDTHAQIVAEAALYRHKRGEEESAQKLWLSEYPNDLTSWYAILAHAVTTPELVQIDVDELDNPIWGHDDATYDSEGPFELTDQEKED